MNNNNNNNNNNNKNLNQKKYQDKSGSKNESTTCATQNDLFNNDSYITSSTLTEKENNNDMKEFEKQNNRMIVSNTNIDDKENFMKFDMSKMMSNDGMTGGILGIGHISIIHLFTRDFLFKKIKIISDHHLETSGDIIKKIMEKLNFSSNINGNYIAFINAVRTEIRKTMCARRGYVKRQIGLLIKGMNKTIHFNLFFQYLNNIFLIKTCIMMRKKRLLIST
jgi:hypothetical protein